MHAINPITWEAEEGAFLSYRTNVLPKTSEQTRNKPACAHRSLAESRLVFFWLGKNGILVSVGWQKMPLFLGGGWW